MKSLLLSEKTWGEVLEWFVNHDYNAADVEREYKEENGTMFYVTANGYQDADSFEIIISGDFFNLYSL